MAEDSSHTKSRSTKLFEVIVSLETIEPVISVLKKRDIIFGILWRPTENPHHPTDGIILVHKNNLKKTIKSLKKAKLCNVHCRIPEIKAKA